MGKYKTKITEYGYKLINEVLSSTGILVTDGWHVALGSGKLEPSSKTSRLKNVVFDKNSPDYPGIIIGKTSNGRYAEIVLPESLHGSIITEIGLFDSKDNLVVCANTKIDCTERTEEGFDIDYRARIDLGAIDSDVVIQFQGGTFQLLEEKGKAAGYAPLDDEAKVPLEHLRGVHIPFCFNSGPVDKDGKAAVLEYHEGMVDDVLRKVIILKSPAVYTDGQGKTTTITEDLTLDVTDFVPGTKYSLRVENVDGTVLFTAVKGAEVYYQKAEPENPAIGDLWQNKSVAPELAYIRTENNTWELTNQVPPGAYTVPAENSENSDATAGAMSTASGGSSSDEPV